MRRLVFLCAAFGLAGMLRAQLSPTLLVLRGGTVVDVTSGKEIPHSVIVIRGERIEQIGTAGVGAIPEGAQIIEARGKWIVPGLIAIDDNDACDRTRDDQAGTHPHHGERNAERGRGREARSFTRWKARADAVAKIRSAIGENARAGATAGSEQSVSGSHVGSG